MLNVNDQAKLDELLAPLNQAELIKRVNEILKAPEPHLAMTETYAKFFLSHVRKRPDLYEIGQILSCMKAVLNSLAIKTPIKYILPDDELKLAVEKLESLAKLEPHVCNGSDLELEKRAAYIFAAHHVLTDALDQHEVAIIAIKEKPLSEARHETLLTNYPFSQTKKATLYSTL
jgi:hypothetical protein